MVFIGDENGEFLEVLLTIGKDDLLSVNDLIKQHKTNIYIETIGRVYQCIKYTCKSWSYDVSYQSSPGCTAIVGKPCEIFSLMKKKIAAAICKSGVWAACHFSVDKVCTGYYETFDVCDL